MIVTKSETIINFRKGLIECLMSRGHEVSVIAHDEDRKEEALALGVDFYCVKQDNRGLNPFAFLRYKKDITKILEDNKPDIVFTFQVKPNTFGVQAAKAAKIENIYSMVEGAGDVFINNSLKWKLVRFVVCTLYKQSFKNAKKVFFLNNDDKAEFIDRKLVKEEQCEIIHGIGVDLERFDFRPVKNYRTFLMVARMLKTKGIFEYCECARIVKKKYPDAVFNYLGAEGSVTLEDIKEYIDDGSINYLGTTSDVRPYLEDCTVMVLPSFYREGLPMSIMEAESIGRAIITTDNIGCRETVIDNYNGFIVEPKNYNSMAEKCIYIIEHKEEAVQMCDNSRKFAEEQFDKDVINEYVANILDLQFANETVKI